jgi:TetR/AcrR family transcriptional repressor of bet genes
MPPRAKRTKTIIARRQDLIRGTIESVARLGYDRSTVQTICEAAGLSRGLVGHYFASKDDLLVEAFRFLTEQLGEETRRVVRAVGDDPLQRLLAVVSVTFREPMGDKEKAPVWLAFWGIARWRPELLKIHRELWRSYRRWIQHLIHSAARERGLKIDARRAAITFSQLIDGLWIGWIMDEEIYELKEAEEILHDWVLNLFAQAEPGRPSAMPRSETSES